MNNFIIFFNMLWAILGGLFSSSYINVTLVNSKQPNCQLTNSLKEFETTFSYPFSDTERFRIEHGQNGDYFAFFKTLGEPYYYVATCNQDKVVHKEVDGKTVEIKQCAGEIAAVACGILRTLKTYSGTPIKAWYLCDLKVNQKYQGEHLPLKIMQQAAIPRFWQCSRGFGICMNPSTGEPKAATIFKRHGPIPGLDTQILNLYTLNAELAHTHYEMITSIMKSHGYMQDAEHLVLRSTSGVKDYLIFNATEVGSRPWQLFHFQVEKIDAGGRFNPQEGATHMICAVDGTTLDKDLKDILGAPTSTAQIVSYGMKDVDFNFLTSNQI